MFINTRFRIRDEITSTVGCGALLLPGSHQRRKGGRKEERKKGRGAGSIASPAEIHLPVNREIAVREEEEEKGTFCTMPKWRIISGH